MFSRLPSPGLLLAACLPAAPRFPWIPSNRRRRPVQVQLESTPPGADATTSLGPGCKTPCSVSVPAPDAGFTVTFDAAQVPAGHRPGPGDPQSRRFRHPRLDHHRSKPGIRRTETRRPAAAAKPMRPKKPKPQARRGSSRRSFTVPDPGGPPPADRTAPAAARIVGS